MGKKRYVPRWITSEVAATVGMGQVTLDPEVFMNKTAWPLKIEHLTVFGWSNGASVANKWAGASPMFLGEIGISGSTDVNLVPAQLGASFFRKEPFIQLADRNNGTTFAFKHPFLLPRDSGFSCEVRKDITLYGGGVPPSSNIRYGVALHGRRVQSNDPVMFAALYRYAELVDGGSVTIDAADLLNDGEEDVMIDRIQFTHDYTGNFGMLGIMSWKVNPLSGLPWMENFVPISGLTPYVQYRGTIQGALPYSLTPLDDTYLFRRQRLGIKFTPLSGDVTLQITLFGYLEVE